MTGSDISCIKGIPEEIISVRGPKTRHVLIQHGINCPEHYGDPVLLLPLFYTPHSVNRDYVSIIPNIGTFKEFNPVTDELERKHGCRLINMTRYDNWTDIVDMIAGSSFVLSESLHGLIVAETYNIPCLWVEFTNHNTPRFNYVDDWSFKFHDFYESIGKYDMKSMKLYEGYDFDDLMKLKASWKPGIIDYEKLLSYFPFEIKPEFKSKIDAIIRERNFSLKGRS
ncbi:MAG: polysaccharide pyruvyl transferase family protein [Synergistaceae bacterium]|nr:polysaccharide pyruvyl transferase family protein [Synergistaceae bacterium]